MFEPKRDFANKKLIDFGNSHESAKTYSDIIVGLPGDSKEKHFESLRFCIDNKVSTLRMHQAIMLIGTEMASEKMRNKHGLKTKFRTVPGAVGYYDLLGKKHAIAEIEEIIVANNTLSEKDYLDCQVKRSNRFKEQVQARREGFPVPPSLDKCKKPTREWKWQ